MRPDEALARIAAKQQAAFTPAQARGAGLTPKAIRTRIRRRQWDVRFGRVYVVAGAPHTWEQDAACAVLAFGPDAVGSHTTAGYLLGLLEEEPRPLHVARSRSQHREPVRGVVPHQLTLRASDFRTINGIRITGPERTLVDLAGVLPRRGVEAALDNAIQIGLTTIPKLRRYISDRNLGSLRGVGFLVQLLADRQDGAMHKPLERMFRRKAEAAGLPKPKRQFPIDGLHVDFAWPDHKLVVELDGLKGHFSAEDARRDDRRDRRILRAGFKPLHFAWEDVDEHWDAVEADVRAFLG